MNIFEIATRENYLFKNPHGGVLNVIDLWNLNIETLNLIGKSLIQKFNSNDDEFSNSMTVDPENDKLKISLEIVRFIIKYKKDLKDFRTKEAEKIKHNKFIDELIYNKKLENLKAQSIEELEKLKK